VQGFVTTIATEEELPKLKEMAEEVGVSIEQIEVGPGGQGVGEGEETRLEGAKKHLEDLYNLY
jgi:hypothetical protein